jgi:hypothetical protein
MGEKLVFVVENVGAEETIKKLAQLKLVYKELSEQIKAANKAPDAAAFDALSVAQEKVKLEIAATTAELKKQRKEFSDSKYPEDSLRALQKRYSALATSIRDMTAAQRESAQGKGLISQAKELKEEINKASMAFGDNSKNIGNYTKSIQKAFEHPLKFLKEAGLAGLIATVGIKLFEMGKNAVEAFAKTEEGAKKLKGVELGFERLKAVGLSLLTGVIEKVLPYIEAALPSVEKAFIKTTAVAAGAISGFKALASNIINGVKLLANDALQLVYGLGAALGFKKDKEELAKLREEHGKLTASIVDVGEAAKSAYDEQIKRGTVAAANAKLEIKANKELKTQLQLLKAEQDAINKAIEKRIELGKSYSDLQAKLAKNRTSIEELQFKITYATRDVEAFAKSLKEGIEKAIEDNNLDLFKGDEKARAATLKGIEEQKKAQEKADEEEAKRKEKIAELKRKADQNNKNFYDKLEEDKAAQEEEQANTKKARAQDLRDLLKQSLKDAAVESINGAQDILTQQFNQEKANIDKIKNERLKALDDEFSTKRKFAAGNAELLARLDKQQAAERLKIETEAAKKQQQIQIKQALADAASAVLRTFARLGFTPEALIALIPLAAATAFQIARIKAQKFDKGGMTGPGTVKDETGKKVAGIVHENEYVSPEHQVKRHANLIHWLNQERKSPGLPASPAVIRSLSGSSRRGYAEGGFTSPAIIRPIFAAGNAPTSVSLSDEQITFFARQVAIAAKYGVKEGVGEGMSEANRAKEREAILQRKLAV